MSDEPREAFDWNVVCAGPSLAHLQPEHLLDGPVVTVNRAVSISERGFRIDFAAFSDGPKGCWEPLGLEKHLKPGMQIWASMRPTNRIIPKAEISTPMSNDLVLPGGGPPIAWLWDRALPAYVGIRFIPTGSVGDPESAGKHRLAFTTLCVLKRVWEFSPKRVKVLCCDMSGSWIEGLTEQECREKESFNRWAHERRALDAEIKRGRKDYGVEVEEFIPMPVEACV